MFFHSKVSSGFLRQDSQSSYNLDSFQNVGGPEFSEEKKLVFHWRKISCFVFIYMFPLVLLLISSFQSVRASEQNSVVMESNPTQANFL